MGAEGTVSSKEMTGYVGIKPEDMLIVWGDSERSVVYNLKTDAVIDEGDSFRILEEIASALGVQDSTNFVDSDWDAGERKVYGYVEAKQRRNKRHVAHDLVEVIEARIVALRKEADKLHRMALGE